MTIFLSTLLLLAPFGCHSTLRPLYEQEKNNTLKTILDVEDTNWIPDARFRFSYESIGNLGKIALEDSLSKGNFKITFLGQEIAIDIASTLKEFVLSKGNDGNIQFAIQLYGDATLTHPLLSFSHPYSGSITGTIDLQMKEKVLTASINTIKDISISFQKLPTLEMTKPLEEWINNVITSVPSIPLAEIDTKQFFSRDIRFTAQSNSFDIELLSHFPNTTPLPKNNKKPRGDWEIAISNDTLSRMVRSNTFALKPTANGIYIDARRVYFTQDNLNIDLRLWKIDGWGQWWRDYDISTPVIIEEQDIILGEPVAKLKEKSPNAELVDPIIVLAEGYILKTISEQIRYTLPKTHTKDISGTTLEVQIGSMRGTPKFILFYGSLETTDSDADTPKPKRKKRSK